MYHERNQPYLTTDQRERYRQQADTQEQQILAFFMRRPNVEYSPERVQELVLPDAPLTSVRRAITDLVTAGDLVPTGHAVMGRYGRQVGTWKLAAKHSYKDKQMRLFDA